ncbi:Protein-L-isoaspartate O-methyltransferase [Roseovarius sp. EC-HK134]|jgi:protein-L-isoaspartate(D-aspartate) O-methyltransferase|uniref:Protein-L-isoaspartate O-methyltransferase n=1 Tax=Roseovarius mucosus TaxID=215743 RepID=A0A1V0RUM6_9RHOB|nr:MULTISPECIES: protein-L-isoaspartate O-methyltransferase [Roseovarius]ARE85396.1 protein-L-isoaspartate O-methyltransferase [Roseovarius mucosus]AWZ21491.1 Protein-L-isoaspartate O-methyltransferase [Roseovarius sp. AK1035]EDM30981.1 protein-L-isoaspartate O-methyltransferase [Roseovarius sp. TM1035]VVT28043.1 Protein-L-isoaspartate O-methyltransferase [Roseovarius sp. EC-SD190]VVT28575.1 Protein-L-isoaspartate O-methyltransferase [Roseovarius sp. EC-HK134]
MTDYAARRTMMVDTQVRPSDVTKFPIIDAMLSVPREAFVPTGLREAAYMGENLDLGEGRVMLDPRTLAKMLDALEIENDDLVLDIGSGYGYSAAVIARMAEAVVAVEDKASVVAEAQRTLSEQGADNVVLHEGPLADGAPEHGPYDVITVQGAVEHLPEVLAAQLKEGGRMACLFMEGALGVVRIGYKIDGRINWRYAFNAGAPVLRGFERHAAFTL